MLNKLFRIWFDGVPKSGADLGGSPMSEVPDGLPVTSTGEIKLDLDKAEKKLDEVLEAKGGKKESKSAEENEESEESEEESEEEAEEEESEAESEDEDSEEDDSEDEESEEDADEEEVDEDNLEEESEENDEESTDEDDSEDDVPQNVSKRLKDTQAAYHAERKKNRELEERIAKLEGKANGKTDETTGGKTKEVSKEKVEVTLENVDPKLLDEAMKKDPVTTMRWIADQQVKLSQKKAAAEKAQQDQVAEFQTRYKTSEEAAVKRFPVIQKVLKMSDEKLAEFKVSHPEQYEFAQKAAQYWKEFNTRGDVDALYNAASRAYADLSPKTLKKIREESKKLGHKEATTKKKILGKLRVESGSGTKPKGGSGFKSLSEDEFAKLSPAAQTAYMSRSVESRLSRLAK